MELQFRFELSDRKEVDRQPGLHAGLHFRRSDVDCEGFLEGTAEVSDDGELAAVTIQFDGLHLNPASADELIRKVMLGGWSDVFGNDFAAVATHWKPLEPWLQQKFGSARAAAMLDEIAATIGSSSGVSVRTV